MNQEKLNSIYESKLFVYVVLIIMITLFISYSLSVIRRKEIIVCIFQLEITT